MCWLYALTVIKSTSAYEWEESFVVLLRTFYLALVNVMMPSCAENEMGSFFFEAKPVSTWIELVASAYLLQARDAETLFQTVKQIYFSETQKFLFNFMHKCSQITRLFGSMPWFRVELLINIDYIASVASS